MMTISEFERQIQENNDAVERREVLRNLLMAIQRRNRLQVQIMEIIKAKEWEGWKQGWRSTPAWVLSEKLDAIEKLLEDFDGSKVNMD